MAGVRQPEDPGAHVDGGAQRRDEQGRAPLLDQDPVGPLERVAGRQGVIDGRVEERPGKGHQERGGDALAGHVGDADGQAPLPALDPEDVEEVAADLARRLVLGATS